MQEGEAYPAHVVQGLAEAEIHVAEGTVYPLLTRLKNDGFLTYRWEESSYGPPRKYYKLTEKGLALAAQYEQAWNKLKNAVDKINTRY